MGRVSIKYSTVSTRTCRLGFNDICTEIYYSQVQHLCPSPVSFYSLVKQVFKEDLEVVLLGNECVSSHDLLASGCVHT